MMNFIKQHPEHMVQFLKIANALYRENGPEEIVYLGKKFTKNDKLFEDAEYDQLVKKYGLGEQPLNNQDRPKIKQQIAFGTLEKFTHNNYQKFEKRVQKAKLQQFVMTPKLDGIGLRIYFGQNYLTRYDQYYGLDVAYLTKPIIQKCLKNQKDNGTKNATIDDYIIRGELIALKDDPAYATKRHQVSAYISKIEIDKNLQQNIIFIPYEIVQIDNILPYDQQIKLLKKLFKHTIPNPVLCDSLPSIQDIEEYGDMLGKKRNKKNEKGHKGDHKKIQYLTDGVVVRSNEISFENENKPKYTIAFKFEDIKYEGVIGQVTYNIKQTGFLVPTIELKKPVKIDNSSIQRASGFNFQWLLDNYIIPGNKCWVTRQNQVIPRIIGFPTEDKINPPQKCPQCDGKLNELKDSLFRYQCAQYYTKCYLFVFLTQAKKVLKIKGMGDVMIQQMFKDGLDFVKWFKQEKGTNRQLLQIIADNMGEKKIAQLSDEEVIKALQTNQKLYNLKFI